MGIHAYTSFIPLLLLLLVQFIEHQYTLVQDHFPCDLRLNPPILQLPYYVSE